MAVDDSLVAFAEVSNVNQVPNTIRLAVLRDPFRDLISALI